MNARASTSSVRVWALIALACLGAYGGTLRIREFFHDDELYIAANPLLHQGWSALPRVFTTGYVEAAMGEAAPVQEYRPVLVLTYLLQTSLTGFSAPPMHAANLLLHFLVCLLLWEALRRRLGPETAAAGGLVYAVMPVHAEAVAMIGWRSELLSAALMLGAWLLLDGRTTLRRTGVALLLYAAALLTKESSVVLPVFLALADWAFHGEAPWGPRRRRLQAALWSLTGAYFLLRSAVLSSVLHGGVPYFTSGRLVAALTVSRFAFRYYLWPALSGLGLCSDFSRPYFPDSSASSSLSWACLTALAGLFACAIYSLVCRRRAWAFWLLGPCLTLLPTSNLVFPLDTLGAQRFLYFPTMGLAAALGWLYARLKGRWPFAAPAVGAGLIAWYGLAAFERSEAWTTKVGFYRAAAACNPVSARARSALGSALLAGGEAREGAMQIAKAIELDPLLATPHYNLARFAWERGDAAQAERLLRRSLELDPRLADAWVLLALVVERGGHLAEAAADLEKALAIWPWDAVAEYNLGRLEMLRGRNGPALRHFARFLELAPDDPDAGAARAAIGALVETRRSRRP